jgi:hypothetical protein
MTTASPPVPSQRTPRALRVALTVIGAAIVVSLVALGTVTLLDLASRHTFDTHAGYTGVRALYIDDGGGDIALTGAPAGAPVSVTEHVTEGLATPRRRAVRDGAGGLHLTASCPEPLGLECQVTYDVAVPPDVTVSANSGAGDLIAGDIATNSSLKLSSGAGDVHAQRISAPVVRLESGAGDVQAQLSTPARLLTASSGAGDVTLTVPDVTYAVHASSGAGSVSDSSLRTDPSAPRTILASSGAGDVKIGVGR